MGAEEGASVQRQACHPAVSEEGCSGGTRIRSAFRTHHSAYGEKNGVKSAESEPRRAARSKGSHYRRRCRLLVQEMDRTARIWATEQKV